MVGYDDGISTKKMQCKIIDYVPIHLGINKLSLLMVISRNTLHLSHQLDISISIIKLLPVCCYQTCIVLI